MKTGLFLFIGALIGSGTARADVHAETSCYVHEARDKTSKPIRLSVRTYFDNDLHKEVGAIAQYSDSKDIIPLVFTKYIATDIDSPNLGNYEISRIEINSKKVTGEYNFFKTGAGNTQGKYVEYRNAKSGKTTIFMHLADDGPDCKFNK